MLIDLIVLGAMVGYAVAGYRQGVVVGALSLAGFLAGALAAMSFVPSLAEALEPGPRRTILVVLGVLLAAWAGQLLGGLLGGAVRERLTLEPARVVDQVLGAVAGLIAVALVLWFLGGALRGSSSTAVSSAIARSRVLATVDTLVPTRLAALADDFRRSVADSDFPRVFTGFGPEEIVPVPVPDSSVLDRDMLVEVGRSIAKVTGNAPACRRGQEGSGVVVAPQRVVTNAHVVAGVRSPQVQIGGVGRMYPARVVLFNPQRDIAVLAVPGLLAPVIDRGGSLERGDDAVVAGFPNNGPYKAAAARVRGVVNAQGDDIYGRPGVEREVYSLYTRVEPGNSGGPLLEPDGDLVGLVFARSQNDATTGYALTLAEIDQDLRKGIDATQRVSSGRCSTG